jgi:hypothetical protein
MMRHFGILTHQNLRRQVVDSLSDVCYVFVCVLREREREREREVKDQKSHTNQKVRS